MEIQNLMCLGFMHPPKLEAAPSDSSYIYVYVHISSTHNLVTNIFTLRIQSVLEKPIMVVEGFEKAVSASKTVLSSDSFINFARFVHCLH